MAARSDRPLEAAVHAGDLSVADRRWFLGVATFLQVEDAPIHRYRYHQLRLAVRLLRYASVSLLLGMALVLAAEIFLAGNVLA